MKKYKLILTVIFIFFGSTLLTSEAPLDLTQKTQEELNALLRRSINGEVRTPISHIDALLKAGANPLTRTRQGSCLFVSAIKKRRRSAPEELFATAIVKTGKIKTALEELRKLEKQLEEQQKSGPYIDSQKTKIVKLRKILNSSPQTHRETAIATETGKQKKLNALLRTAVNGDTCIPPSHIDALLKAGANPLTRTRQGRCLFLSTIKRRRKDLPELFTAEIIKRGETEAALEELRIFEEQLKEEQRRSQKKPTDYTRAQARKILKLRNILNGNPQIHQTTHKRKRMPRKIKESEAPLDLTQKSTEELKAQKRLIHSLQVQFTDSITQETRMAKLQRPGKRACTKRLQAASPVPTQTTAEQLLDLIEADAEQLLDFIETSLPGYKFPDNIDDITLCASDVIPNFLK